MRLYRLQLIQTPVQLFQRFHGQTAVCFICCGMGERKKSLLGCTVCFGKRNLAWRNWNVTNNQTTRYEQKIQNAVDIMQNRPDSGFVNKIIKQKCVNVFCFLVLGNARRLVYFFGLNRFLFFTMMNTRVPVGCWYKINDRVPFQLVFIRRLLQQMS